MKSVNFYSSNILLELLSPIVVIGLNVRLLIFSEFSLDILFIFTIPSILSAYWYNANAYTNYSVSDCQFSIFKRYSIFRRKRVYDKNQIFSITLSNKKLMKWGHPIVIIKMNNGKSKTYHSLDLPSKAFNTMIADLQARDYNCIIGELTNG